MVKFIKSVKKDIVEKDIYIWNVNHNSMEVLLDLGIMSINVKGFVIPPEENRFYKKTILNRPLITIEDFCKNENAVLIASNDCVTIKNVQFPANVKIYKYDDILSFDYKLLEKNVYIYGTGGGAKNISELLYFTNTHIKGYVTTTPPFSSVEFLGQPVKKYNSKYFDKDDAIIISVKDKKFFKEIFYLLKNSSCDVYVKKNENPYLMNSREPIVYILNKAITENKKVFVLTDYENIAEQTVKFLELYGLEIINKKNYTIDKLYELKTDNDDLIVFFNEWDDIKRAKVLDELKNLGFYYDKKNICSLQMVIRHKKYMIKDNIEIKDYLIGHSQSYGQKNPTGWKVLGNISENKPKIIILGGSTSTEDLFAPETWMTKLYKKLSKLNLNCNIYIGAAGGYRVINELLKLLRDGHIIKPDIVISMSGVNDTDVIKLKNKFVSSMFIDDNSLKNSVVGMSSEENSYEYWVRVEKIMKLYSNSLNSQFFSFLQPMSFYTSNTSLESKMLNEDEHCIEGAKEFVANATHNDFYINLIDLFHNKPEMFIDSCHYSTKGEEILSDKVLENILPTVKEIYKKF